MVRGRLGAVRVASLCSVLVFAAAGCSGLGGGEAACAARASEIDAEPSRVDAGGPFRLQGTGFADYRERGGFPGEECPPPLPELGIPVEFRQGGETRELARVDGDDDLAFEAVLEVPEDAEPGEAVVRATSRGAGLAQPPPPAETSLLVRAPRSGAAGTTDAEAERCVPIELYDAVGPVTRIEPGVVCEQDRGGDVRRA